MRRLIIAWGLFVASFLLVANLVSRVTTYDDANRLTIAALVLGLFVGMNLMGAMESRADEKAGRR